jgi:hypothetical protein
MLSILVNGQSLGLSWKKWARKQGGTPCIPVNIVTIINSEFIFSDEQLLNDDDVGLCLMWVCANERQGPYMIHSMIDR